MEITKPMIVGGEFPSLTDLIIFPMDNTSTPPSPTPT
jgi:hypothetical protein